MTRVALIPPADRLGMSRPEAAEYIGVSPSLFDIMVMDGRMPRPKKINSRTIWDRRQIEQSFADLPDGAAVVKSDDRYSDLAV